VGLSGGVTRTTIGGMTTVETVRGPVEVNALGSTLMHEHVFVLSPDIMRNYGDEWWDEDERVTDAIAKLRAVKAAGIDTIVDPTVIGLGRDIPRVARINAEVDLHSIVATGLYTFDEIPHYFHACYMDFFSGEAGQHALATTTPNWHVRHISEDVLPALREQGVTGAQITTMMVDNPRRYFS
jgi:predicted metal-dependent phosphotriesterase family hydrolase